MPVIQRETSVAAGATDQNLYNGSAYEFARVNQVVSCGITAAVTGSFFTLQSGGDVVVEETAPVVATRFPIIPDEMYYNDVMAVGDRLVLRVRNPTGGAIIHRTIAQLQPLS